MMNTGSHRKPAQCFLRVLPVEGEIIGSVSDSATSDFDDVFLGKEVQLVNVVSNQIINELTNGISVTYCFVGEPNLGQLESVIGSANGKGGIIRNVLCKFLNEKIPANMECYEFCGTRSGLLGSSHVYDVVAGAVGDGGEQKLAISGDCSPFPGKKFSVSLTQSEAVKELNEKILEIYTRLDKSRLKNHAVVRLSTEGANAASAFLFLIVDELSSNTTEEKKDRKRAGTINRSMHTLRNWIRETGLGNMDIANGFARTHVLVRGFSWAFEDSGGNGKFVIFARSDGLTDQKKIVTDWVESFKEFKAAQKSKGKSIVVTSEADSSFRFAIKGTDTSRTSRPNDVLSIDFEFAENALLPHFSNVSAPESVKRTYIREYINSLSKYHKAGFRSPTQLETAYGAGTVNVMEYIRFLRHVFSEETKKHENGVFRVKCRESEFVFMALKVHLKQEQKNAVISDEEVKAKLKLFFASCEDKVVVEIKESINELDVASRLSNRNWETIMFFSQEFGRKYRDFVENRAKHEV